MNAPATQNPDWGFWGTATCNGSDPQMTWNAAADALARAFGLKVEEVRTLLDARFGRHLADDLSFIAGGPTTPEAVEFQVEARLANRGWRKWFEVGVSEAKSVVAETGPTVGRMHFARPATPHPHVIAGVPTGLLATAF